MTTIHTRQVTKQPDYNNMLQVLTEVLFTLFDKFTTSLERSTTTLLSGICQQTVASMSYYIKNQLDPAASCTIAKTHLKTMGYFRDTQPV